MKTPVFLLLWASLLLPGWTAEPQQAGAVSPRQELTATTAPWRVRDLSTNVKARILALNPDRVTEEEVKELLSPNPAPQIIGIHGGILPIKTAMRSFAQFLMGMGYPATSLQNPGNGSYSYGYYHSSERIAGTVAWHYERDGLRPMLVGHSQGGIQAIRVLHLLAGGFGTRLQVWNPVTRREERRHEIIDPLTGRTRPVVGLQVSYATAALSGGLARALPNVWDMNSRLRKIPDSVEEFTGFQKSFDILGGDYLGYGPANDYRSMGGARVRNVRLPATSSHSMVPYASRLLKREAIRDWIHRYPTDAGGEGLSESSPDPGRISAQVLWAAEVWHGIKKHWVLELQRLIRAQRDEQHDR